MKFTATALAGLLKIELDPIADERGFFARAFCADEFATLGLPTHFEQISLSRNIRAGTLRGMHFQKAPYAETKFIRCTRGSIFDVVVDLRRDSSTFCHWVGETLSAENGIALLVPPGFAHGFETLEDESDVLYQITPAYEPGFGDGVRFDDPAFAIRWPSAPIAMSERDAAYPDFRP